MPLAFDRQRIEGDLAGITFIVPLAHLPTTGSTNALALEAASAGARSGIWVADEQTAGRGRGGHAWHSAPGEGLYVSALVAPPLPITAALKISLATGLAAQRAILAETALPVDLRWPNDLLLHGRKCGGILVETAVAPAQQSHQAMLRYAVIGIGINLNHSSFPPELDAIATSLGRESSRMIARDILLITLLRALDDELGMLVRESAENSAKAADERLLARFTRASTWVSGKAVRVDDRYTGTTVGLTDEGFLRVIDGEGMLHVVHSGGVRESNSSQP